MVPRAFVSYSWDSDAHRRWVRDFATRLRRDGVDAALDQWSLPRQLTQDEHAESSLALAWDGTDWLLDVTPTGQSFESGSSWSRAGFNALRASQGSLRPPSDPRKGSRLARLDGDPREPEC